MGCLIFITEVFVKGCDSQHCILRSLVFNFTPYTAMLFGSLFEMFHYIEQCWVTKQGVEQLLIEI